MSARLALRVPEASARYSEAMDPARQQRILRQHVDTDRLLGVEAVPMGEVQIDETAVASAAVEAPRRPPVERRETSPPSHGARDPAPAPRVVPSRTPMPAATPVGDRLTVLNDLDQHEVKGCTRCGLHAGRNQTVFGEGNPAAELMIIGEGPGADEDRTGRPFVGRAGQLLDKQIQAMGYKREDVYIANVVKCRPPGNRAPTPHEAEVCGDYLHRQIMTIQPKVILTVGGPAAKLLLSTESGITRIRGNWHAYERLDPPIPVMPTFHPAYLLRAYTPENRRKVWNDLQAVMQRLGRA